MTSLITRIATIDAQISQLEADKKAILDSREYASEAAFHGKLKTLMDEYGMGLGDVIRLIEPATPKADSRVPRKQRAKVAYKNPNTQEVIHTQGGNHRTLREWRQQWGKDVVAGWKL